MVRCEPISLFAAPSTVHWFPTAGEPLKEISTAPNNPLLLLSKPSPTDAPGTSVVNCTKLRPFMGSSRTCSPSMTFPTSPVDVLTAMGVASTITVSVAAPMSIFMLRAVTSATCSSTLLSVSFLKPVLITVTVYVPGSSSGNEKLPCSLVVVLRVAVVRSLVTLTVAPGTAAPLGSVTDPVIRPVIFCADTGGVKTTRLAKEIAPSTSATTANSEPAERNLPNASFEFKRLIFIRIPLEEAFSRQQKNEIHAMHQASNGFISAVTHHRFVKDPIP